MELENSTSEQQATVTAVARTAGSRSGRIWRALVHELGFGHAATSWIVVRSLLRLLPPGMFVRTRAAILRSWGLKIGKGTTISGTPVLAGDVDPRRNLTIGDRCCINWPLHLDVNAPITIGDRASIGHHVVIITTDHEIGDQLARACGVVPKPVTIGSGSWIGAAATILPGTTIGDGAIVSAGALVSGTVAPNTVVGGVPARFIRNLQ